MRMLFLCLIINFVFISCSTKAKKKQNGISLTQTDNSDNAFSLSESEKRQPLITRPTDVLRTAQEDRFLISVYKIMYAEYTGKPYTGTNKYYRQYVEYDYYGYEEEPRRKIRWNNHFMPGIEAMTGKNMMNVGHYDKTTNQRKKFFETPVLINTLYYPAIEQDSLDNQPITRDYYMVSVYDEDTNQDSIINQKDLRRFYHFDLDVSTKTALIPENYSVQRSDYDPTNDVMFVYAKLDENGNGRREIEEPVHIFWIDLEAPKMGERVY